MGGGWCFVQFHMLTKLENETSIKDLKNAFHLIFANKASGKIGLLSKTTCTCWWCPRSKALRNCVVVQERGSWTTGLRFIELYTNEGDNTDCNNPRGASLLNINENISAWFILPKPRLQTHSASQCGFRDGRFTIYMYIQIYIASRAYFKLPGLHTQKNNKRYTFVHSVILCSISCC